MQQTVESRFLKHWQYLQLFFGVVYFSALTVFGYFQALYFTGNYNADLAAAWIFENQDKNLDAEFNEVILVDFPPFTSDIIS